MKILFSFCLFLVINSVFACEVKFAKITLVEKNSKYISEVIQLKIIKLDVPAIQNDFPVLNDFQTWVEAQTNTDPVYLIEKQEAIFKKHLPVKIYAKKKPIYDYIVNKEFKPIHCLEAFLTNRHLTYQGEKTFTEFRAIIFRKQSVVESIGNFQILFHSNSEASAGLTDKLDELFTEYRKENWEFYQDLHLHPFTFTNPYGDIVGTPFPSGADFESFCKQIKKYKLKNATITNGFHTIYINHQDLDATKVCEEGFNISSW